MNSCQKKIVALFLILFVFTACKNEIPFEKSLWIYKIDNSYPYRKNMLNDLISNEKLIGISINQLIEKIGNPEQYVNNDSNKITYDIVTEYGLLNIDPNYIKQLHFFYNNDSLIIEFKINEIKL